MPRRPLPKTAHADLLRSYRQHPADHTAAAAAANVDRRTARKAYDAGLAGQPAISRTLEDERNLARMLLSRFALASERERAPEEAKAEGAQQLAAEALICRALRGSVIDLLATAAPLRTVGLRLMQGIGDEAAISAMSTSERIDAARSIAAYHGTVAKVARDSLELERLRVGDATSIIGLKAMAADEPLDDAAMLAELQAEARAKKWALPDAEVDDAAADASH